MNNSKRPVPPLELFRVDVTDNKAAVYFTPIFKDAKGNLWSCYGSSFFHDMEPATEEVQSGRYQIASYQTGSPTITPANE